MAGVLNFLIFIFVCVFVFCVFLVSFLNQSLYVAQVGHESAILPQASWVTGITSMCAAAPDSGNFNRCLCISFLGLLNIIA